jgi:hypothetical protein
MLLSLPQPEKLMHLQVRIREGMEIRTSGC